METSWLLGNSGQGGQGLLVNVEGDHRVVQGLHLGDRDHNLPLLAEMAVLHDEVGDVVGAWLDDEVGEDAHTAVCGLDHRPRLDV